MKQTAKNIFWLSFSRVLALGLLFLVYTQVFRYLGPFGYGQYQFALSYVTLFSVIVDFGISQYVVKKTSEKPETSLSYFYNFFAAEIVVVLILYAALAGIGALYIRDAVVYRAVLVAGLGMVINGLTFPFLAVISAYQDLKKVAFINFLSSLINTGVLFLAIILHKYIVFMAAQQVIFGLASLILYRIFIKKYLPNVQVLAFLRHVHWGTLKSMLIAAVPFALLVGFSTVYNRIDVVIISKLLGFTQTGFYAAAYKFVDLMNFFPAVVSHSLYPAFASLIAQKDLGAVRLLLERYSRLLAAFAVPMAMGVSILSYRLIELLAGEEFVRAQYALGVLSWAVALLIIYITVNALVISQLTKKATIITGINIIVNIVGNILLLPRFGFIAAAWMTVVSEAVQCVAYFYFVRKYITHFAYFRYVWKVALAAVVMGAVIWPLRMQHLFISVPVGVIVYASVLLGVGFISKDDLSFIKRFLKRGEPAKINS